VGADSAVRLPAARDGGEVMAVRLCTSEYLISTVDGVGLRRGWFPRIVAEKYLTATKDGEIKRSPDPVPTILGDVTYVNGDPDPQTVIVQLQRGPRSIVTQSPNTVVIHDAWSWAVGADAAADFPSVGQETFGGGLQVDRPEAAAKDIKYGRTFLDCDSSQTWIPVGDIPPGESLHFRYLAAIQTPGVWTTPSEFEPRWEAFARWARLLVFAGPAVGEA